MAPRDHRLTLEAMPARLAVARLGPNEPIPQWVPATGFTSITRTADELSIVCAEERVPTGTMQIRGLVAIRVSGTLAPDLVGVLASLANPLADAGVPILAIGTHDTDYVLVRAEDLGRALESLRAAGHRVDAKIRGR